MTDNVNKPKHYQAPFPITRNYIDVTTEMKVIDEWYIQALDVIKAWDLGFNLGNTVKYILRSGRKGEIPEKYIEDLKKARFYLNDEIEKLEDQLSGN